jgi:hypothetical protein
MAVDSTSGQNALQREINQRDEHRQRRSIDSSPKGDNDDKDEDEPDRDAV